MEHSTLNSLYVVVSLLIQKYGIELLQAAADADAWIASMLKVGLVER